MSTRARWASLGLSLVATACGGASAAAGGGAAGRSEIEFRPAGAAPRVEASAPETSAPRAAAVAAPIGRDAVGRVRPETPVPQGPPPTALQTTDVVVGAGREAVPGTRPEVHYVGVAWSTGSVFDASWDRGQPFAFALGQRQVIPGWEQGLVGMREGGRRQIVIPPALGYGARGAGSAIAPNETLIFVVDLIAVH